MPVIKTAVLQMNISDDKKENLQTVWRFFEKIKNENIDLAVLPEIFICPYQTSVFPVAAEEEGGDTWRMLSGFARDYGIYLAAGSVPEYDNGKIYNTGYIFDRQGKQIGKHRKVHLFDIQVKGGQHFKESDTLSPGDAATVFDTEFGKMGLCICYDIRFPEIFRLMVNRGAQVIIVPGAFNMTTGPAHWELLFRTRAMDNQVFMVGASPARRLSASYHAWGHSMVVDPWGNILAQLDEREGILTGEMDLSKVDQIRDQLPLLLHRRHDIYELIEKE